MAKFSACYQLCPLIDQKGFIGVTDESENGCAILTLGKNMVIRYKLSDQKQVSSWSSRDKLTAPVVYDAANQRYIGVFNATQISTWEESCIQLNNLKKFKFSTPIECVLTNSNCTTPVVVFRNGNISPLQQALDKRKEVLSKEPPLAKDETIKDAQLVRVLGPTVVALFTSFQGGNRLHLIPLEEGLLAQTCLSLKRKSEEEVNLIGHTFVTNESCQLLTLWSDGHLFRLELPTPGTEHFPGQALATLTCISTRHPAAILSLSPTHLAIYGADVNEEGALLVIFNSQLGVTQCKQHFKLYTEPARLWAGGCNALLVASGQYVTVVPYQLGKQRLAALVGSQDTDTIYPLHAAWGSSATPVKQENKPDVSGLQQTIQSYVREGLSQRMICQNLLGPSLDSKDLQNLNDLLDSVSDIPETCIISVVSFCLQDIEQAGYRELLRKTLSLPITADLTTLRLLRQRLGFTAVLSLLRELCEAMLVTPADPQLIEWATLLLDAHYPQYLLSKDDGVVQTLNELKAIVESQITDLNVWQQLEPLLLQMQSEQGLPDQTSLTNTTYSIEQITLY